MELSAGIGSFPNEGYPPSLSAPLLMDILSGGNAMLTQNELKNLLCYNPITGVFINKVDRSNNSYKGDVAGCVSVQKYRQIVINGTNYMAHRLAWLYVYGYFPEHGLDHIDRDPTNNKINNLREVSQQCNSQNAKIRKDNKSGVVGVHFRNKTKKWRTQININGKRTQIGSFVDFTEAVAHRLAIEQCIGWSTCDSSSTAYKYMKQYCKQNKLYKIWR